MVFDPKMVGAMAMGVSYLLIIIGSQGRNLDPGVSGVGSKVWVWSRGSLGVAWYATVRMGWPLEARRSLFPDWFWLCAHRSAV